MKLYVWHKNGSIAYLVLCLFLALVMTIHNNWSVNLWEYVKALAQWVVPAIVFFNLAFTLKGE